MIITKEQVLETIQELPPQFSLHELVERLSVWEVASEKEDKQLSIFEEGAIDKDNTAAQRESATTVREPGKISYLRKQIQTRMTKEDIEQQMENLRNEWERNI